MKKINVGWEEWISMLDLGVPALIAKTDTGAQTSSLHAFNIQKFGKKDKEKVRFGIQPIPDDPNYKIFCSAKLIDERKIRSSNGMVEVRYVISTILKIGELTREVEITLSNRENMNYKMLIGRSALEGITVKPNTSFLNGELSYSLYKKIKRKSLPKRSLRIAILTREPNNFSTQALVKSAESRDHDVELIDTKRCYLDIKNKVPRVHYDNRELPFYDVVIPRIGASITHYGMAVVRHFQAMGTYCLNSADSIGLSRDKLAAHQILSFQRLPMPNTAFGNSPKDTSRMIKLFGDSSLVIKLLNSTQGKGIVLAESQKAAKAVISAFRNLDANFLAQEYIKESKGEDIRCLVLGRKVIASMVRTPAEGEFKSNLHAGGKSKSIKITTEERRLAVRASRTLGLNLSGVDIIRSDSGPKIIEVNSSPGLQGIQGITKVDLASKIIQYIEMYSGFVKT